MNVTDTKDGIIVASDNLKDVHIVNSVDEKEVNAVKISSDSTTIKVDVDNQGIKAYEDANSDGVFDKPVEVVPVEQKETKYSIADAKVGAVKDKTYTGKSIKPAPTVTFNGNKLVKKTDYTLSYKNNKDVGKAKIIITGKGQYTGSITKYFKIKQAAQAMKVSTKVPKVKYSKVKNAKQTIKASAVFTVKKSVGKVTYTKVSGSGKLSISKAGMITVKKGTKKGTYSMKVKVKAAGNKNYKAAAKTVTVKVKVA